ncbi:hypothetical protein CsatB_010533 [Cannabis sativa]
MYARDHWGGDNHIDDGLLAHLYSDYRSPPNSSDSSSSPSPLSSSESSGGSHETTCPIHRVKRLKRILPRWALYFLHEGECSTPHAITEMANPSSQDGPEENEAHTAPQNPPTQKRRTQQEGTAPHMATKKQKKRNQQEVQRMAPTLEAKARYDQSTWDPNVSIERPDSSLESSEVQSYLSLYPLGEGVKVVLAKKGQKAGSPLGDSCAWTKYHIEAGATLPLHDYFREVANYFDILPAQIAPHGYLALSALFIIYHQKGWGRPSPHEIHYLLSFRTCPSMNHSEYFYFMNRERNQPYVFGICSTNRSDKHRTSYFFTTPMDTTHRASNHTGTYSRPIPTEEMIKHAAALTAMPDAEKSAPKIVTPETLKLVGLYPLEHNTTVASTIDGPDAPAIPIDGGNPSHGNFTTADSSIHMSLPPTTSRRDTGVIVGVDSNPEDTTMLNDYSFEDSDMFHQLIASYGESEDVNESGGEESAPDLPLVPRACSQLRKPCPAAVEGEENAQASPSVPNIGGRMRRPSIVVPIIRPDDATIQMLESVHDNIDLLVRKTATVEVVRDMSNYEGDTVTKGVQDILRVRDGLFIKLY